MSKISQFTTKTAPALTDTYLLETGAANYNVEASLIMGLGLFNISGFRLSADSTLAVPTADINSTANIYLQPHISNRIIVPDSNGSWKLRTTSALTLALGTFANINLNYDVFVWDNAGTLTLALGTAWTSDTTRANALTTINGVYVNGSTEGSMAANRGLHVGIIRSKTTTTTADSVSVRMICNRYNRIMRQAEANCGYNNNNTSTTSASSTSTYAVFTNPTIEVVCLAGDTVDISASSYATNTTATQTKLTIGISNAASSTGVQSSAQFQALSGATAFFKATALAEGYSIFSLYRIGVVATSTWTIDMARSGSTSDPACSFMEGKILA